MKLSLRESTNKEFELIVKHIAEFELDNRDLQPAQFTAAFREDELVGFGRLRDHKDALELCSLGVITPLRRKGIGKALVRELISRSSAEIYVVCIIPEFFIPFGFRITGNYPSSIFNKLDYCRKQLSVPEEYVVMQRKA